MPTVTEQVTEWSLPSISYLQQMLFLMPKITLYFIIVLYCLKKFFLMFILFFGERKKQSASGGGAGSGRHRIRSRLWALSTGLNQGSNSQDEIVT